METGNTIERVFKEAKRRVSSLLNTFGHVQPTAAERRL
jgi:hypothetical protein